MAILLDACFLLAYDNEADIHHQKARSMWKEFKDQQIFISDYVFDEIMGVTRRKLGHERATIIGDHILQTIPLIMIDNHLFKESWQLFKKEKLSFTDCTIIVLARLGKLSIATFDKELRATYPDVLPVSF